MNAYLASQCHLVRSVPSSAILNLISKVLSGLGIGIGLTVLTDRTMDK